MKRSEDLIGPTELENHEARDCPGVEYQENLPDLMAKTDDLEESLPDLVTESCDLEKKPWNLETWGRVQLPHAGRSATVQGTVVVKRQTESEIATSGSSENVDLPDPINRDHHI